MSSLPTTNVVPDQAATRWWTLDLVVPAALAEEAAALMVDEGAMGAQIIDQERAVYGAWQQHASMGPAANSHGPSHASAVLLVASYDGAMSDADVREAAAGTLPQDEIWQQAVRTARLQRRSGDDWAHRWRQYFKPMKVGRRLWIVPSWEGQFKPPAGAIALTIDPGMAFGTGQHATTALCLRSIERFCETTPGLAGRSMLDVGCGSGVLTLAGLKLGIGKAVAIDIDAAAVATSQTNLAAAGLGARVDLRVDWPPEPAEYALVVANILAGTLETLAEPLVRATADGGALLLSGLLTEQVDGIARHFDRVIASLGRRPFAAHRHLRDRWALLTLVAPKL